MWVAPERARTRVAALLLLAAAVLLALLSLLLSGARAHRAPGSTGLSAAARTPHAAAARESLGQTPERISPAVGRAGQLAQLAHTGADAVGQHLTAVLAAAGLIFAFLAWLARRPRRWTPGGTDLGSHRSRGPPRAAARLA